MRPALLTAFIIGLGPVMATAERAGGSGMPAPMPIQADTLDNLRWRARPVVVLGQGEVVDQQMAALQAHAAELADRDVFVLTDGPGAAPLRARVGDGFVVMLIGKDGTVKLSERHPVDPTRLMDLIDSMPMRRKEQAS
ncbi:DUF4174 domain-containing protein [Paracoccus sp. (in: a-proteobacteria)]|uniref:DUF4174 domain-containing protein n=1 Tax=Paracoccus sp. TaxID=267 RepID=UPI00396CA3BD